VTVPETTVATQCRISEGTPKTDSSLTVHVVCSNANIQNATVTLKNTTKPVEYTQTGINDYIGFAGLSANTSYTITLSVTTNTETLSKNVSVKTKETPVVETPTTTTPVATSITHNGTTYGFVTSPYTGKVWLDRNLGASQVCTSSTDVACYGDYYQWGRNTDGHEDSGSGTTGTQATDVNNAGNSFILSNNDWASVDGTGATRTANWSATDGSSVCPIGFRVPTIVELNAELLDAGSAQIQNRDDAFNSFLKFPSAGWRLGYLGTIEYRGDQGTVWSSSVNGSVSQGIFFDSGRATTDAQLDKRGLGQSVRCLKD